jgi:hypothetical protein
MTRIILLSIISLLIFSAQSQDKSAQELLIQTINYHDPAGNWNSLNKTLFFEEIQPEKTARSTEVKIDNTTGYFRMNRGNEKIAGMLLDSCFIEKGDLNCERAEMMRNYYLYLWGLPMKLLDKNTPLSSEVGSIMYEDEECHVLQVNYEKDTWSFYISSKNFSMKAYKFIQKDGTGELIKLQGLLEVDGMKIPKERSWYTIPGNKHLGTDILVSVK